MKHTPGLQLVVTGETQPCSKCGRPIEAGEHAFWQRLEDAGKHRAWHLGCDQRVQVGREIAGIAEAELKEEARREQEEMRQLELMDSR
jgi:hypothetical protein